jgi:hypothetical protein
MAEAIAGEVKRKGAASQPDHFGSSFGPPRVPSETFFGAGR